MHRGFDAASAVIFAPSSRHGAAQIPLRLDRIVTGNRSFARPLSSSACEHAKEGACVGITAWGVAPQSPRGICEGRTPIGSNAIDLLIGRDLVQKFGQHGSITNVADGDFDCPSLQRFLVDSMCNL